MKQSVNDVSKKKQPVNKILNKTQENTMGKNDLFFMMLKMSSEQPNFKFVRVIQIDSLENKNFEFTTKDMENTIKYLKIHFAILDSLSSDYNPSLNINPNGETTFTIKLKTPEHEVKTLDEIQPDDYNSILNNIQLFDQKYRDIIHSDNGITLDEFVNFYCAFQNRYQDNFNDEQFHSIDFLPFLEKYYIDKKSWKISIMNDEEIEDFFNNKFGIYP